MGAFRPSFGVLLGALFVAACAGPRTASAPPSAERVYSVTEVDVAPELVGCSNYAAPPVVWHTVNLEFVVDPSGQVVSTSIRPAAPDRGISHPRSIPSEAIAAARDIAANCVYRPGRVGEEPVAVRMWHGFRLGRG